MLKFKSVISGSVQSWLVQWLFGVDECFVHQHTIDSWGKIARTSQKVTIIFWVVITQCNNLTTTAQHDDRSQFWVLWTAFSALWHSFSCTLGCFIWKICFRRVQSALWKKTCFGCALHFEFDPLVHVTFWTENGIVAWPSKTHAKRQEQNPSCEFVNACDAASWAVCHQHCHNSLPLSVDSNDDLMCMLLSAVSLSHVALSFFQHRGRDHWLTCQDEAFIHDTVEKFQTPHEVIAKNLSRKKRKTEGTWLTLIPDLWTTLDVWFRTEQWCFPRTTKICAWRLSWFSRLCREQAGTKIRCFNVDKSRIKSTSSCYRILPASKNRSQSF